MNYLLPIVSVLLGAVSAFFFNRWLQSETRERTQQAKAYSDFMKAVAENAAANKAKDKIALARSHAFVAEARVAICLYGSDEVIRKLDRYLEAEIEDAPAKTLDAMAELFLAMRHDSGNRKSKVTSRELWRVLFSKQVEITKRDNS